MQQSKIINPSDLAWEIAIKDMLERGDLDFNQAESCLNKLNGGIKMNEQKTEQKSIDWLNEEKQNLNVHEDYDELPSMKFEENKILEIVIDFTNQFQKWTGEQGNKTVTKAIIPVTHKETKMNWWLNVRNPVYALLVKAGTEGKTKFRILQTGKQADTKYTIVED